MLFNRRQFLISGLAAAAGAAGLSACAPSSNSGGDSGPVELGFAWWGNDLRAKNTNAAIAAYAKANPDVTIDAQPGEFASYWDKLATQTAGGTAPDIVQMDMAYISEYGSRGALLDLAQYGVDTSKFTDGTVDAGRIAGTLVGVNAGVNTPVIMVNPAVFEKAKVDLPEDTTWTWEQAKEIGAEITAKTGGGTYGMTAIFNEVMLSAYLRQHGKELFVEDGLGFEASDIVPWFDLSLAFQDTKAMPPASELSEDSTASLDQSLFGTGKAAMATFWSNQVEALSSTTGSEIQLARYPSAAGRATERKAWYKAAMLWSASSKTKHPEAVAALLNWWVNSTQSADINLAERGIPANTDMLAAIQPKLSATQQDVATFLDDIRPELAASPVPPPPGGGTVGRVLLRHQLEVLFGRTKPGEAATNFADELQSNLQV